MTKEVAELQKIIDNHDNIVFFVVACIAYLDGQLPKPCSESRHYVMYHCRGHLILLFINNRISFFVNKHIFVNSNYSNHNESCQRHQDTLFCVCFCVHSEKLVEKETLTGKEIKEIAG